MEGETLRSRLAGLLQKSRKAVRLYTNFEKPQSHPAGYRHPSGYSYTHTRSAQNRLDEASGFFKFDKWGNDSSEGVSGTRESGVDAASFKALQVELTSLQLSQWQSVNTDLQRQITAILDRPHSRLLGSETVEIRDRFYGMWRAYEADLRQKQIDLAEAVSRGDFVRAAILAKATVMLKAREQAAEAAQHEIQVIVERFKLCSGHAPGLGSGHAHSSSSTQRGSGDLETVLRDELIKLEDPVLTNHPTEASSKSGPGPGPGAGEQGSGGRVLAKVIPLRRSAGN